METNYANSKREALKSLSNRLCDAAKKAGNMNVSCNYLLKVYYLRKESSRMLKTFEQWKELGLTVKEGAKGKPFWGAPKETEKNGEKFTFCPIRYWFSDIDIVEQESLPLC